MALQDPFKVVSLALQVKRKTAVNEETAVNRQASQATCRPSHGVKFVWLLHLYIICQAVTPVYYLYVSFRL
jgi:hypothetical protein